MIHDFTLNVSSASNPSTQSEVIATRSPRPDTSITKNEPLKTSGMDVFRKVLENEEIPELGATTYHNFRKVGLNI